MSLVGSTDDETTLWVLCVHYGAHLWDHIIEFVGLVVGPLVGSMSGVSHVGAHTL